MNRESLFVVMAVGLACPLTPGAATALLTGQEIAAQRPALVEVVGCLTEAPASLWAVVNATEAVAATVPYTTEAALKEAASKSLGTKRYRLLGVEPFNAELHKGQKIAVKGLLIRDSKENRLNVTSLQMVAPNCTK